MHISKLDFVLYWNVDGTDASAAEFGKRIIDPSYTIILKLNNSSMSLSTFNFIT